MSALALIVSAGPALANVVVVDPGGVSGIKRGDVLDDKKKIEVPLGRRLTVTLQQNGKIVTKEILGRRAGLVSELLTPESLPTRIVSLLRDLIRNGGTSQDGLAGTRGFNLYVQQVGVATALGGGAAKTVQTICVEEGQLPLITLGAGLDKTTVRVQNPGQAGPGTTIELTKANARAAWPSAVGVKDNVTYRLIEATGQTAEVRLRSVPSGMLSDLTSSRALVTLQDRGCSAQVENALWQTVQQR